MNDSSKHSTMAVLALQRPTSNIYGTYVKEISPAVGTGKTCVVDAAFLSAGAYR